MIASVSYVLGAGDEVELLRTSDANATTAINLTGNEFANRINGNAGNNILNGGGGVDILDGLAGNDSYFVDSAAGRDHRSRRPGHRQCERVGELYAWRAALRSKRCGPRTPPAPTPINLTGNEFTNIVTGNAGVNVINGKAGNDTLTGNAGNDFFLFNTALNAATNVDTIADFVVANDTIRLENAIFTGLAAGTLNADAFHVGAAAADAEDRVIYNNATGALSSTPTAAPPAARSSSRSSPRALADQRGFRHRVSRIWPQGRPGQTSRRPCSRIPGFANGRRVVLAIVRPAHKSRNLRLLRDCRACSGPTRVDTISWTLGRLVGRAADIAHAVHRLGAASTGVTSHGSDRNSHELGTERHRHTVRTHRVQPRPDGTNRRRERQRHDP